MLAFTQFLSPSFVPFCFLLCAFLLGSIPVGYVVGRLKGVDVRTVGSGNVGATNVGRTAGKSAGLITLIGDILKGFVSATLPVLFVGQSQLAAVCALCAVVGHCYSPFLNFRGGKGVATGVGGFALVAPAPTLCAVFTFAIVYFLWRFVSLASIAGAIMLPIGCALLALSPTTVASSAATAAIILVRHIANMKRLLAGSELRRERNAE